MLVISVSLYLTCHQGGVINCLTTAAPPLGSPLFSTEPIVSFRFWFFFGGGDSGLLACISSSKSNPCVKGVKYQVFICGCSRLCPAGSGSVCTCADSWLFLGVKWGQDGPGAESRWSQGLWSPLPLVCCVISRCLFRF